MHKLQLNKKSQKYKKIRKADAKKRFKLPGEIAVGNTIKTKNGGWVEITVKPPKKISSQKVAKKIKERFDKIRRNKIKSQKIADSNEKNKILKEIDTVDEIKTASDKKEQE